jgi:hypothetical protein
VQKSFVIVRRDCGKCLAGFHLLYRFLDQVPAADVPYEHKPRNQGSLPKADLDKVLCLSEQILE